MAKFKVGDTIWAWNGSSNFDGTVVLVIPSGQIEGHGLDHFVFRVDNLNVDSYLDIRSDRTAYREKGQIGPKFWK